jgi:NAD(P)-dependent dehydrogenase (short-subunit alcohol dehydrogenase family)
MKNDPANGARVPRSRSVIPLDIAMPAFFLTSGLARYITGSTLPVNGGFLCH